MQFLSIPSQSHTTFQSCYHIHEMSLISTLQSLDLNIILILLQILSLFPFWNHGRARIHQVSTSLLLVKGCVYLGSSTCVTDHITSCLEDLQNHNESDFYWTWSPNFKWLDCTYSVCQRPTDQQIISLISVIDSTPQLCFLFTFLCPVAGTIFY